MLLPNIIINMKYRNIQVIFNGDLRWKSMLMYQNLSSQ